MAEAYKFHTKTAVRLVSGSLSQKRTKDIQNKPVAEEDQRYETGFALPKNDPDTIRLINEFHAHLSAAWANDQNKIAALNAYWQTLSGISLKISDGDKPNSKGRVNPNTQGCYVMWFSNWGGEPIKTVNAANQEIPTSACKRGYYFQIAGEIKDNEQPFNANPAMNRAGIYAQIDVARLLYEGDVITGGVDVETAFGDTDASQIAAPAGARALGSQAGVAGALPGAQTQASAGVSQPVQAPVQTAPAGLPVQGGPGLPNAQPPTASPTNAPVQGVTPHAGILAGPAGLPGT